MSRRVLTVPLIVAALVLTACSACTSSKAAKDPAAKDPAATQAARRTHPVSKVLVVVEENHSLAQMRAGMPFLARLSRKYGYATHWKALTHPSEPNYLAIVGGSTFGVTDDETPQLNAPKVGAARSVFEQARSAGRTAATFAESMPGHCYASDAPATSVGRPVYAVRHNPWVYFASDRAACQADDVGLGGFLRAAGHNALPNVGLLIPNVLHDAHDGSLGAADVWLHECLRPVLRSRDFKQGRLVVVVTADEDDKHAGNTVLTSVLTPRLHHKVVTTPLTHYSLTRYIAQVLHRPPLRNGATAPDMRAAFGL
jgi:acid phosphatase